MPRLGSLTEPKGRASRIDRLHRPHLQRTLGLQTTDSRRNRLEKRMGRNPAKDPAERPGQAVQFVF